MERLKFGMDEEQLQRDINTLNDSISVLQFYEGSGVGQETIDEIQELADDLENDLKFLI